MMDTIGSNAKPWVAYTAPMEIGGDEAVSYVTPDHEGNCAIVYETRSGEKEWCVFPSFQEASMAAGFAARPDIGGYGNVEIRSATEAPPNANIYDCAVDWM